ncbi:fumarylacetoacetate hydrolase family protein [Acidiferrimicrobium sp. IK]|uniref:fumarylacetoacetate hydrolase family protein n=1 Tax=Acidiferrimicrobium sp. IK TaxID=2871700 RepID=UPI0021CB992B|nr:fumarylacetoacetate hydrolase family protein [Acidiferrimicrobium sp. IK]MCU4185389.1 fumarylacetoacetate hydrolase family protein [Acidiferrimicrobium sp. IK]
MRLGTVDGRASLLGGSGSADVARASGGRFGPDPLSVFEQWDRFRDWASDRDPETGARPDPARLGPPVPAPRQVFAIGLNYKAHAAEAGYDTTGIPQVFTKFPSCLAGPVGTVRAQSPRLDWEVELVVAVGRRAESVAEERGWDHVAGLTVGQDLSARDVQLAGAAPQWSLGKSFPGFGPTGPWLVDPADLDDPDDLAIECSVNGEVMQQARTSQLIWSVPQLIARLSSVCPLLPGDLIFTGTPAGVGNRREPPKYLQPGDRLVSRIGGIGELVTDVVAP